MRAFTFDNIDVLLDRHPGVDLAAVQAEFVGRGRGGYCFEHGYVVRGGPGAARISGGASVGSGGRSVAGRLGRTSSWVVTVDG